MTAIERVNQRCAEAISTIDAGTYSEPRGSMHKRDTKVYWPLGTRGVDGRRRNGRVVRSWKRGAE
jgi:hypothetical protein